MISMISALYNAMKYARLEKDYQKATYYILESISACLFLILLVLFALLIKI